MYSRFPKLLFGLVHALGAVLPFEMFPNVDLCIDIQLGSAWCPFACVYGLNLCPSVPKIASMRNSRIMVVIGDVFVFNPIVGICHLYIIDSGIEAGTYVGLKELVFVVVKKAGLLKTSKIGWVDYALWCIAHCNGDKDL